MGAKHAKWFVHSARTTGWLREMELVPKTQGIVDSIRQTRFALKLARARQGADAVPAARGEEVKQARALYDLVQEQGRSGYAGSCRARRRSARRHDHVDGERDPYGEGLVPAAACAAPARRSLRERERGLKQGRVLQGLPGVAVGEGARLVDPGARAEGSASSSMELESVTCCGAGDIHEAEPDYYLHLNARILSYAAATGCDTLLTVCNVCTLNLRQANWQLIGDAELRARVNRNLAAVGVPAYEARRRRAPPALGARRGRGLRAPEAPRTRACAA